MCPRLPGPARLTSTCAFQVQTTCHCGLTIHLDRDCLASLDRPTPGSPKRPPSLIAPTGPRLFLIASLKKVRATIHSGPVSAAHYAAGRPVRRTNGSASAVANGTPSTRVASAQSASTSGLKPSACPVADGRRIRTGTLAESVKRGCTCGDC